MEKENCSKKEKLNYCFLGIGGISMSALALFLKHKGNIISGFDRCESKLTNTLKNKGIKINDESSINDCDVVVVSSAIAKTDLILEKCLQKNKKIITRSQLLKQISDSFNFRIGVAGTHGKTTTTAMLAHILNCANLSFCAHIGGLDNEFGNIIIKGEDVFLSEVCEYKKNISLFDSEIALLLNCSNDHVESYGSFSKLKEEFFNYLVRSKKAIVDYDCIDISPLNVITFSAKNINANYYASDIVFGDSFIEYAVNQPIGGFFKVKINSVYPHDIKNSLASVAVARELGIKEDVIKKGLLSFKGVARRSENLGKIGDSTIFADYAHHPEQIKNTIERLNKNGQKYALFFQSHTFSRTKTLIKDFVRELSLTQNLFIFDTYGARENFDYLGSGKRLSELIKGSVYCGSAENAKNLLPSVCKKYPLVAIIGAGDLYDYCEQLIDKK